MVIEFIRISCPVNGRGMKRYKGSSYNARYFTDLSIQDKIAELPGTQGVMPCGIIIGSDKTTVSVATGQNEYYPLYMSLTNFTNEVRRAHGKSVVLLGFLAIPKGEYSLLRK
jgi:hypothetical protein